jgi:hypothetical protein
MTIDASPAYFETARALKNALLERMFGVTSAAAIVGTSALASPMLPDTNILGVGYGAKVTSGAGLDVLAVRVYVRAKAPRGSLSQNELVPDHLNGVPTDVIPVGDVAAQFPRPVRCGVSCGHVNITAGTLGCLVTKNGTDQFILSNNHVLADSNSGSIGDDILEPGPLDGGKANPPIAHLSDFEPIDFSGNANSIDAAIAELVNATDVDPEIDTIGAVQQPPMPAALYQSVRKRGRTTLHTIGVIMDLAADIRVRYGTNIAQFEDQIAVSGVNGAFSAGGDSGSLVVDAVTRRPVALLFAGGTSTTFCNHISNVISRFGITIR